MSEMSPGRAREGYSYFPGCTSHSTAVEYDLSTKAVLKALGVELVEIEDWNCCGAAAVHSMNKLLSLCLPARNIAMASMFEAIGLTRRAMLLMINNN